MRLFPNIYLGLTCLVTSVRTLGGKDAALKARMSKQLIKMHFYDLTRTWSDHQKS